MEKKLFLIALLVFMAVLGAKAQTYVSNSSNEIAVGNGNVVTRNYDVTGFDEISLAFSASVIYTVADDYSCRLTLDENLFEYIDIYLKDDCLRLEYVKTYQRADMKPTKCVIELTAPTLEEISLVGGGSFSFVTPFEAPKLEINMAGAYGVFFDETATIRDFKMNLSGTGNLLCKNLHADHANLGVAGPGSIVIEAGAVKSADITVAGSGFVKTLCQLESMDYNITGTGAGRIYYYGDVKAKGTTMFGKIERIDSENVRSKEKQK